MKKLVPNQLINQTANVQLSEKSLNSMMKSVLILMFTLFTANISAQQRVAGTSGIMEVEAFLSTLRNSDANSRSGSARAAHLESLINDNQPSVYFNGRGVRSYGDNPIVTYTNPASLPNLRQAQFDKSTVEIVTIRLNTEADKNSILDLSVLSEFPNLKYVYILSDVKTTGDAITKLVKNASAAYSVFYKIAVGS